ncbi:MAG: GNAT family N-acetyltransferase [Ruminococcus sp.]|nr:GNAT family N-acetyltransferase [Ruminococcus sp.]
MSFFVYTMEYKDGTVESELVLRNYAPEDYEQYRRIYEDSFQPMRSSLGLPRECCKSSAELLAQRECIFILEDNGRIIGSVAIYGNEIDDLFVSEGYRQKGFGLKLLRYAVACLQKKNADRIFLHAADVNKAAVSMYLSNGFVIAETEEIV